MEKKTLFFLIGFFTCVTAGLSTSTWKDYLNGEMRDGIFYCDTTSLTTWLESQVEHILTQDPGASWDDVIYRLQKNEQRFVLSYRGSETLELQVAGIGKFFGCDSGAMKHFDQAVFKKYEAIKANQATSKMLMECARSAAKEGGICILQ